MRLCSVFLSKIFLHFRASYTYSYGIINLTQYPIEATLTLSGSKSMFYTPSAGWSVKSI